MEIDGFIFRRSGRTVQGYVAEPVLSHDDCDLCGNKQYEKIIAIESEANDIFSMGLCSSCAQWLASVLPELIAELGAK